MSISTNDTKEQGKGITRRESIDGLYRLSGLQQGMLFHGLFDPGTGAYINHFECDILGLDFDVFKKSWNQVLKAHTILRSVFYHDKLSTPVQCVFKEVNMPMDLLDFSNLSADEKISAIKDYIEADSVKGFDFSTAPLMRVALIRLDEDRHRMIWTYHHIIVDGWSIPILISEFLNNYETLTSGKELVVREIDRFEDFIRYIERTDKEKEKSYWKTYLGNVETGSLLPFIGKTAERNRGVGEYKSKYLELSRETTERIQSYAKRNRITVNTVMQGVWSYCLHRYTGNKDILFGVIVSGRPDDMPGVEQRVGLFINPLPLHSEFIEDQKASEWLQELQTDQVSSRKHQHTTLTDIQAWTGIQGDLFDCLLTFENYPVSKMLASGNWNLKVENVQTSDKNNYPLTIIISISDQISLRFSCNTELLKEEYVKEIISHFENVILQFIGNDEIRLKEIEMLTESERNKLLEDFSNSHVDYPCDKTVTDLFEEQVLKTPDAEAVVYEGKELSYKELNSRANKLAHYLKSKGVKDGMLIPLCTGRGVDMVVGLSAILKTGAAYVPVDTDIPDERIKFILGDTQSKIVLTDKEYTKKFLNCGDIEIIEIDGNWESINQHSDENPSVNVTPENLAYVIYTSGSTGKPKGVMIDHKNLVDYVYGLKKKIPVDECRSFALMSTIATDLGNTVLYGSLLSGGSLHLFSKDSTSDVDYLHKYFKEHNIDCIKIVPSHWKALRNGDELLLPEKLLVFGGEVLRSELIGSIRQTGTSCTVVNHYGPTETTIGKLLHVIEPDRNYENTIPIGKPFSNTNVYVVSNDLKLCPVGIPGQLYISGDGIAKGYLNNAELTKQKFIKNPFRGNKETLMYGTGDLVKFLPDGNIEFIGRVDDQVKVRGYRIELGEIESILLQNEMVSQAAVTANEDKNGNRRLAGYVIPKEQFNKVALVSWLKEKLPEYMLPSVIIELESFPLTPNGKIDRKALPDPDTIETSVSEYAEARNEVEEALIGIWKELLDLDEVGIHDNFFELGGDSIISIQLVSRARRLGYEFLIGDVFTYQTIARMSALLEQRSENLQSDSGEQDVLTGPAGLLPIQQWYFEKDPPEVSHFNQSLLLGIDKGITDSILKRAVEQIKTHHDALRFKYYNKDGEWQQAYEKESEISGVIVEDLQSVAGDKIESIISEKANIYQRSLDIEKGEIVCIVLMLTPESEKQNRLLIIVHHLAIDGVSWRIMLEDLELLITGLKGAGKTDLGKKSGSFRQWYETLEKYGKSNRLADQKEYWEKVVKNYKGLPVDKDYTGEIKSKDIGLLKSEFESELTQRLIQDVPKVYHTEINDILLAALAKTLCTWSKSDNVVIGMEGHGRESIEEGIDTSRTIGWLTTHYPVLFEVNNKSGEDDLIKSVKEQLRLVPDKGLGYGVLKYLNKEEAFKNIQSPDIRFNYLGQSDNVLSSSTWFTLATEPAGSERNDELSVDNKIYVSGIVLGGKLVFNWSYSVKHYEKDTIEMLAAEFEKNLKSLITHSLERQTKGKVFTPSDFGLSSIIKYQELDAFLDEEFKGKHRRESIEGLYKLSGLQQGMLFHGLYEGGAGTYIRQLSCDILNVDLDIFKKSWNSVLRNHSILRSAFYYDSFSIPVQCVYDEVEIPVEILDYSNLTKEEQLKAVKSYDESEYSKIFDFKTAPLMRLGLLRLTDERYHMLWTWNHILFDGWSLPVLMEEFLSTYKKLSNGSDPEKKSADNYEDFIKYLEQKDKAEEEMFWRNYMKDVGQGTLLPFVKSSEDRSKGIGEYKSVSFEIGSDLKEKIQNYTQSHYLTLNTLIQGIWSLMLHSYTGNSNVVYGIIVSGRPHDLPAIEERVGLYINTLPLRSKVDEDQNISEWLKELQSQQISLQPFHHTPLIDIQVWTDVKGDLFDSLMVFENYPVSDKLTSGDRGLKIENTHFVEHNNYPLTLTVNNDDQLRIEFRYNSRLLEATYINEMTDHFKHVLMQILQSKEGKLKDVSLLDKIKKQKLLFEFNDTKADYPKKRSIADLFEEQALKTPGSTAVVFDDEHITYKELNEKSNRLANYLIEERIQPGNNVGLLSYRNFDMIIGMLGILKAGCAYVPLNTDYPADRLKYIIKDADIKNIVYTDIKLLNTSGINEYDCIDINNSLNSKVDSTRVKTESNSPVYIMYTSGTTGNPKGIVVCNSNVTKLVFEPGEIKVNAEDRMLQWSNYSFDGCVYEIYSSLLKGASLHLIKDDAASNVYELARVIKEQGITICFVTTALFNAFVDIDPVDLKGLRKILFGGEMVSLSHVQRALDVLGPEKIVHVYGPTETTVYATYYPINKISEDGTIPIGGPLANTELFVLNNNMQPVPVGVQGELYIGGDGVALGYINNESLTKEKFVSNPFSKNGNDRLYRTGDLVRWLPEDNSIEFIGRIDNQVKIRGYRIELGEIESILQQHESVKQAAVVAVEDKQGTRRLVGYVTPDGMFDREEIVTYLEKKLPEYMVPSQFVELENFPLNSSGKIDRKALPDPEANELLSDQFAEPRNETERVLAELWMELLEVDRVGINDDFFELGGHSLLAIRLISAIRRTFDIEVDINSVFENTTLQSLADYIQTQSKGTSLPAITKQERPERIPLTFSQERLWFIDQLEGSVQYHVPAVLRLKGNLNIEAIEHSLQTVVNRHEILRSVILQHEGQAYQRINSENTCKLTLTDGAGFNNKPDMLRQYILKSIRKPFDLSKDSMIRAELITLSEQEFMLVVTMHHIISDAWSMSIMVKEVVELYRSYIEGRKAELSPLQIQFADYAIWQRKFLQGELFDSKLVHWKNKLKGVIPLNLPTDFQRPSGPSTSGASASFLIERELSDQLRELSQQQGSSLYMTLLSAFSILLQRYSGQSDICVGTSIASRQQHEIEGLIGFFVNTLALRSDVNTDLSFSEFLNQVKQTTLEAYENQEVPFEKVVDAVVKDRDPSRSPLFQVMLVLLNTPAVPKLQLGDVELTNEKFENDVAKFEITFFIDETPDGLLGSVQYRSDLFSSDTLNRMIIHFKELLKYVVKDPEQKVGMIPMLTEEEEIELLTVVNSSIVNYPKDKSAVDLFEEQVRKTPDADALVFGNKKISYLELNDRANQLAHHLRSKGVKEETLVPLYIERGLDMMVGILGILKSGAAYVPVDTDFPQDRIRYMLEDTGSSIIISSKDSSSGLPFKEGVEIINIEDISNEGKANLNIKVDPHQLAYVIYTSGSTGKPKGVMIEHRNLVDYVFGLNERTRINECQSFALVSTIATDLGNTVIYSSLLSGGAIHLFTKESVSNIEYLHKYFAENKIDCLKIVPSHWKALMMENKLLIPKKLLVFGGEALQSDLVEKIWMSGSDCVVVNHYGPTETTIGKLLHVTSPEFKYENTIPVGKPFSNTKIYILSKDMQLCPAGVPGQLYISGDGVARGYYHNAELTKEKFIDNPFEKNGAEKSTMYGTGDLVKYLPDGNVLFIGRVDNQVKIRGYRIELGEIENILQQSDLVSQAVVLAREDKQGNKRLVGYIIPEGELDKDGIASWLKEKLPEYMIPSMLIEMKEFPLTANGKIDRNALPDPDIAEVLSEGYIAPRNDAQRKLAEIWEEVLEVEQVGINDDFFELGGHSLLAVRLVSLIRKEFNVEMPIGDIFDYPTIAKLAGQLEVQSDAEVLPAIEVLAKRPERIPLSFSQERLWFIDKLEGSTQYHVPSVLRLKGKLNKEALVNSLKSIINRHEILRTVIREEEGQGYQFIQDSAGWDLQIVEGKEYTDTGKLKEYIKHLISTPFNLSQDYMLRAHLIKMSEEDHVLVVTMHHIASDGWSRSVIVKEFVELYGAFEEGRESKLQPLLLQYADYAMWQRKYLQGEVMKKKLEYWKKKLEGTETLHLPTDNKRPAVQSFKGAAIEFKIDKVLSEQLQKLSQQNGTTLFMTLLAAFKVLLYRYSGQHDICVGTPVAGRPRQELEGLIGFFINTLAIRSIVNGNTTFKNLLGQLKSDTLNDFEHQDVPFEKVVEKVVIERELSRSPLFQVMFIFQNTPEVEESYVPHAEIIPVEIENETSKFDLTFSFRETSEGLHGTIAYCTDLYRQETIDRMAEHFKELLSSIVKAVDQSIGSLSMLTGKEYKLLSGFNNTKADNTKDGTIIDVFEEQAAKTPGNIALVFGNKKLTFGEVNVRSNRLAHFLRSKGVKEETLVPICIERSIDMLIGILGIMKAGGAYVPVDPEYPQERINYILENTAASIVVTDRECRIKLPVSENIEIIDLDKDRLKISKQPSVNLQSVTNPNDPAYVIYTSGSTGKPKGVMIEHKNLISYLLNNKTRYINEEGKGSGSFMHLSFTFDASVTGIFMPLLFGRTVVIASNNSLDAFDDKNLLKYAPYDFIKITPTHLEFLLPKIKTKNEILLTKRLVVGGEPLLLSQLNYLIENGIEVNIVNEYGPTEATVGCSVYSFNTLENIDNSKNEISIGKPIDNVQMYLLSEDKELVPVGVTGYIYIGGYGLARGYLNNPELTKEYFIQNPFDKEPGLKLYRTGDIGRWLPDGNIEFLGRMDDQVKIRGYRIELGEIESVLQDCKSVRQSVVLARETKDGGRRLIGYVVPEGDFDKDAIKQYLSTCLPEYMVPALFVEMKNLPLTQNGKVDRRALPDPDAIEFISNEYIAPRNETERALSEIWKYLLQAERVGIKENFFELGGHSLMAMRLRSEINKELKTEISISAIFNYPTIELLAVQIENNQDTKLLPPIRIVEKRPNDIPLSFSQERLWFIDKLEGSIEYHIPSVLRLKGKLNREALRKSLLAIIKRHEVLRTMIREEAGVGYQCIKDSDGWKLKIIDGTKYKKDVGNLQAFIKELIQTPFSLSEDFMLRAHLIKLSKEDHVLVVTLHHIACDGSSASIIVKEFVELYVSYNEGRESNLLPIPLQYADYAMWQRKYLQGEVLEKKLGYWKEKLEGAEPIQLPTDFKRSAMQSFKGAFKEFKINKESTEKLRFLSQHNGASLFMTLLAVFNVMLYKYSGQNDICVGTPVEGRQQGELGGLIGFFVNTIVLRSEVNGENSFSDLLQSVRSNTLSAFEHQEVPFEKVVSAVVKERNMSRSPLFQVMFLFQNVSDTDNLRMQNLEILPEPVHQDISKFELTFSFKETGQGLEGTVEYCTDLFSEDKICRMSDHFVELLNSILDEPDHSIDSLSMLNSSEKKQLLSMYNDTAVDYPKDKTIIDLFEEQVLKTPDKTALVYEDQKLNYRELNERSNQLARYLLDKGVMTETFVPICIERGIEMIIGILGILKAGGVYVPVDPEYPEDRIHYMLEDTGALIAVSGKESSSKLHSFKNIEIIELDGDWEKISKQPSDNLQSKVEPHNLAYVIYTSGSTGKPKGVLIEHYNVVRLLKNDKPLFDFTEKDVWTMFHSFCFDFSVWEMYGALLFGGRLVIVPKDVTKDAALFSELLIKENVTVLNQTPSAFYVLQDVVAEKVKSISVRYVIFGGEALNPSNLQLWKQSYPDCRLINMYGITETTVHVTYSEIEKQDIENGKSIIGKPIPTLYTYILDSYQNLSPLGATGEMFIGGAGVARGYLNRPDLTKERFVKDPFSNDAGARLYRTGDMGRWLADGNIEYLGRMDEQVKIRGYRIELGEIESVLQGCELVRQTVVLAPQNAEGSRKLVGYVVPKGVFDKDAIVNYLSNRLPDYMVPAIWMELENLPLTQNGKVNRKALPDPDVSELLSNEYIAPRNEPEKVLAEIWKELLQVDRVGINDNFFELGGDSIITIQVLSRARRLGYELKPKDIFIHQTIGNLSRVIEERSASAVIGEQGLLTGMCGLLPIQQWYFDESDADISHFNQSVLLSIEKSVTPDMLNKAVEYLMAQHDALRFRYQRKDGQWIQEYGTNEGALITADLIKVMEDSFGDKVKEYSEKYQRSLDIEKGEITRFVLMKSPETETHNRLLIIIHHLAVDGVSWRILLDDLELLLSELQKSEKAELGSKSSSYRQWYEALEQYGKSNRLLSQASYWEESAENYEPLKVDKDYEGAVRGRDIETQTIRLNAVQTQLLLQEVPRVYHTEINDMLLCALALTFCEWGGKNKIIVGLEGHGREIISEGIDTSRTVGWFTSLYPVLLNISSGSNISDAIKSIKEQLRRVPDKGLGYGVLKYINGDENLKGKDSWDIVFNYFGQLDNVVSSGKWLSGAGEQKGAGSGEEHSVGYLLSVNSMVQGGELILNWSYSSRHYKQKTIIDLIERYQTTLQSLITHCIEQKKSGAVYTPSDYGLGSEISYEELDQFLKIDDKDNIMSF